MNRIDNAITDLMVLKYDTCPHWVYFDLHGDPTQKLPRDKWQEMLFEQRRLDEERLVSELGEHETPKGETLDERAADTLDLMKEGVPRIYKPVIATEAGYVAEPDILERRDDAVSEFGAWHYEAMDIRGGERITEPMKTRITFYADILENIQGYRPTMGYVITGSGTQLSFSLGENEQRLDRVLSGLESILSGECPPPHLASACRHSPWVRECVRLAEKTDDIALLYNVKFRERNALRELGFTTVTSVAEMNPPDFTGASFALSDPLLERLHLQARALKENKHFNRRPYLLPSAPMEIFFDIEGDPLRGLDYLYGFFIREKGETRYESFVAEQPGDERRMWKDFLHWYGQLPHEAVIYHYGNYERQSLAILDSRYGGSKPLTRFRSQMRDLNEIIKDSIVFPLHFYGLKDIGCYIGHGRDCDIKGGAESVGVYEDWLATGDRSKLDAIVSYNREDCVATMALKDWLVQEAGK